MFLLRQAIAQQMLSALFLACTFQLRFCGPRFDVSWAKWIALVSQAVLLQRVGITVIGNVLNIKQLEALVWVSELGSFRKAAHHLGTTQPNISSRISGLEKTLQVVLMERDADSVRLTEKGREILVLAQSVLTHARHTQAFVELMEHLEAKSLSTTRLAASSSLASCVQMAADGMGVTLLPKALIEQNLIDNTLVEIDVEWKPAPLRFAARFQSEKSALYLTHCAQLAAEASKAFKETLQANAKG